MKRAAAAVAAAIVLSVTGCSAATDETISSQAPISEVPIQSQGPETTDDPDIPSQGSDTASTKPVAKPGSSDAAVASVCEAFVTGYAEFSPFDFDPAKDWQARWTQYATPALVGRSQLGMSRQWAWTWQTARKAFDVRILNPGVVGDVVGEPLQRVVEVKADRLILGMNETGDKARTQELSFVCHMELPGDDSRAVVANVVQTPDSAPKGN